MAYPVIETLSSGSLNSQNTHTYNITMPSGLSVGDLIVCFISITSPGSYAAIAVPTASSTTNFSVNAADNGFWSTGTRIYSPTVPDIGHNATLTTIIATAYATNTLQISSCLVKWNALPMANWILGDYVRLYSKPCFICYRISGAYLPLMSADIDGKLSHKFINYAASTSNWNLPAIPNTDDSDSEDYLWLLGAASPTNSVAAFAPSGFTMIQGVNTINGDSGVLYSSSLSTAYKQDNAVTQLDPGTFTANSCDFASIGIRIRPSGGGDPIPDPPPSGGIGMNMYKKGLYVYVPPYDSIEALPAVMDFDYEGTECSNPFNTYVQVVALGNWTAAWSTGTYFEASTYAGGEGVHYIAITCKGTNSTGSSYLDTLTFTCGSTYDYVNVEQYQNGVGCS